VIPMLLQHHCGRWGWPCLVVNLFMAVTDIEFWTWSMPFSLDLLAQHPADLRLFAWGFDGGAGCKHYYCSNNNYHCPFPLPSAQDFNSGTPFRHSYSMAMASCMTFSPSETYVLCSSPFRTRPSPLCTPLTGCNGCNGCNGMQWDAMSAMERGSSQLIHLIGRNLRPGYSRNQVTSYQVNVSLVASCSNHMLEHTVSPEPWCSRQQSPQTISTGEWHLQTLDNV
jgi:hypothetical protein